MPSGHIANQSPKRALNTKTIQIHGGHPALYKQLGKVFHQQLRTLSSSFPMAAIINYLIQVTVASDIQNIISGTGDIVTLASSSGIYDALDRKLTVAFSMLSSVPIISFAVLSGSYMGLSKMGDRMTGAGQGGMMDASMAERQTFKPVILK